MHYHYVGDIALTIMAAYWKAILILGGGANRKVFLGVGPNNSVTYLSLHIMFVSFTFLGK